MSMPVRTLAIGEECPPEGEARLIESVVNVSLEMLRSTPGGPTGRPVPRGQHPKSHGCVRAEFTVGDDVPTELRHGVFREARTYTALVRFSNGKRDADRDTDLHGMAIKLLGVEGSKVLELEKDAPTLDFVLADQPVFFIRDLADYVPFSEQLFRLRRVPSWWLLVVVLFRAYVLGDRPWRLLIGMTTKPADLLGQRYWSQTPYKLDRLAVKYSVRPVPYPFPSAVPRDSKDRLREALAAYLGRQEAWFDFLVQVQTDPEAMPVEDATVVWDEAKSPPTKVATLRIPVQQFDTPAVREFDENLSFTPWHALETHRPLGGINRCRKRVYDAISEERHRANHVPRREPTLDDLPGDLARGERPPRVAGSDRVLQPIMPLDLPVKVRSWELTVYPRSHIRR